MEKLKQTKKIPKDTGSNATTDSTVPIGSTLYRERFLNIICQFFENFFVTKL